MRRSNIRIMKMNSNNRSILMRALYADFCANREAGLPNNHLADFRNQRIATGGYTDAADDALIKLFKAKPPLWPFG